MKIFDYIIVGAGIAGLYTAYELKKKVPEHSILILEKENRIGGRMGTVPFHGSQIPIGAGVGRWNKDVLLKQLLTELGLPPDPKSKYQVDPKYGPLVDLKFDAFQEFKKLRLEFMKEHDFTDQNFTEYALQKWSPDMLKLFVQKTGYHDYLLENVFETLFYYGMEDAFCCWEAFPVPWNQLLQKLVEAIGIQNILTNVSIQTITRKESLFVVHTETKTFFTERLILATDISGVLKLAPITIQQKKSLENMVRGQPFLRVYVKLDVKKSQKFIDQIKSYTVVGSPLQKIIPINSKTGIFMIAYCDNSNAVFLQNARLQLDRKKFAQLLEQFVFQLLQLEITIQDWICFYWPIGTHYFPKLVTPIQLQLIQTGLLSNLFLVGEAFSHNQGWVEGALESVQVL